MSDFRRPRKENSQFLAGGLKGERHAACKICKVDFSVTLTSVSIMSPVTREANYSLLSLKSLLHCTQYFVIVILYNAGRAGL